MSILRRVFRMFRSSGDRRPPVRVEEDKRKRMKLLRRRFVAPVFRRGPKRATHNHPKETRQRQHMTRESRRRNRGARKDQHE